MRLKNQRLIFIIITIISTILLFIFYSFIQYGLLISINQSNQTNLNDKQDYNTTEFSENLILERSMLNENQMKHVFRLNNQWIVNKNIIQYSIYVIMKPKNVFSIESFVFRKDGVIDYKCSFLIPDKNISKIISATRAIEIISPMSKVFCETNEFEIENNTIIYAAIVGQNGPNEIIYQRAVIIDSRIPKIKSVGHCVHGFRGLDTIDSNKTNDVIYWIKAQKRIGIGEIRFYNWGINDDVINFLKKKFRSFVSFVDHRYIFDKFCGILTNDTEYQSLCQSAFDMLKSHYANERINTNDCYLNFKYKYEMFTNYDIDEIIFPRMHYLSNLNNFETISCNNTCLTSNYNIYEYGKNLFELLGRETAACLMFVNIAFANFDQYLDSLMSNISNFTFIFNETNYPVSFQYKDEVDKGIRILALNENDLKNLKFTAFLYNKSKCLKKGPLFDFNRIFAFVSDGRFGKSILNTSRVETVNQHSSDEMSSGTGKQQVPIEYGYASHFRDYYKGFYMNYDYPVRYIFIDIEYYLLYLNIIGDQPLC